MKSDLIERQAAIDEIDEWIKAFLESGHKESAADACLIQDGIIQLQSAQPDLSSYSDKLWRAAYERGKAEAQRMRGRWMLDNDGFYVCDQCGEPCAGELMGKPRDRFCKWCGADMREGEQNDS